MGIFTKPEKDLIQGIKIFQVKWMESPKGIFKIEKGWY